jgi:hypothetical protein
VSDRGADAGGAASRNGSVYMLLLVAIPVLLGMVALSLDMGRLACARQEVQAVADAAALAGAGRTAWGPFEDAVKSEAIAVALENAVLGDSIHVTPEDVSIGLYDPATGTMTEGWPNDRLPHVRVRVKLTADSQNGAVPLTFSRLFGIDEVPMTATAVAGLSCAIHPRLPVEIAIVQDCSGSFQEEIETAKDADKHLVSLVDENYLDGDGMGVVAFNTDGWRLSMGRIPARTDDILASIDKINRGWYYEDGSWHQGVPVQGYTHTELGIQCAHDLLNTYGSGAAAEQVIVLVSDGMPNPEEHKALTVDACNAAAADGIRIHTVTYDKDSGGGPYGMAGSDAAFNASLVRNGGYAFHTPDPDQLQGILGGVGAIEIGQPMLIQ